MKKSSVYLLLLLLVSAPACELFPYEDEDQDPGYFVEAYLVAGQKLAEVKLSRFVPLEGAHQEDSPAVNGAEVRVSVLDNGSAGDVVTYRQSSNGTYRPESELTIEPGLTYRLDIRLDDGERIRAETTVPDTFHVAGVVRDTVVYQGDPFEFDVTPSRYKDRQSYYILSNESLEFDDGRERVAYYDSDSYRRWGLRILRSDIMNENNFEKNGGTIRLQLPWLAVGIYGLQEVTAYAIDDNLYDFYRSHQAQRQRSDRATGDIPHLIDNIEGATGVFGSMAGAKVRFYVEEE